MYHPPPTHHMSSYRRSARGDELRGGRWLDGRRDGPVWRPVHWIRRQWEWVPCEGPLEMWRVAGKSVSIAAGTSPPVLFSTSSQGMWEGGHVGGWRGHIQSLWFPLLLRFWIFLLPFYFKFSGEFLFSHNILTGSSFANWPKNFNNSNQPTKLMFFPINYLN